MPDDLINRLRANAEHLMTVYPTSQALLNRAVQGAMPWASALAMRGATPSIDQLETLTTQLLAILIASKVSPVRPVKGFNR